MQRWADFKGLAVDVAVTSPLAATYVSKEPCEWYAATQARPQYENVYMCFIANYQ